MRGPIAPPQVPLSVSRADAFADLVYDSRDRLERRWSQLAQVDFLVLEVPGFGPDGPLDPLAEDEGVPLGRVLSAGDGHRDRIVIYRRPVEIRTKSRDERALLVHEVVVDQRVSRDRSWPAVGTSTEPRSSGTGWMVKAGSPPCGRASMRAA